MARSDYSKLLLVFTRSESIRTGPRSYQTFIFRRKQCHLLKVLGIVASSIVDPNTVQTPNSVELYTFPTGPRTTYNLSSLMTKLEEVASLPGYFVGVSENCSKLITRKRTCKTLGWRGATVWWKVWGAGCVSPGMCGWISSSRRISGRQWSPFSNRRSHFRYPLSLRTLNRSVFKNDSRKILSSHTLECTIKNYFNLPLTSLNQHKIQNFSIHSSETMEIHRKTLPRCTN